VVYGWSRSSVHPTNSFNHFKTIKGNFKTIVDVYQCILIGKSIVTSNKYFFFIMLKEDDISELIKYAFKLFILIIFYFNCLKLCLNNKNIRKNERFCIPQIFFKKLSLQKKICEILFVFLFFILSKKCSQVK